MKPLKCIIIDDEPIAIRVIQSYAEKMDCLSVVGGYTDALDALKVLREEQVDLIFLDIHMPGVNGLEFFKSIPNPPAVIFTTAFRNYAADAFDINALDYMVKPISFERFLKGVNKLLDLKKGPVALTNEAKTDDYVMLKADKKNYRVASGDILYIESLDDYVKVHTKEKVYVCYLRLKLLEEMLDSSSFVRVHRAYIVNLKHIAAYTCSSLEIAGKQIPIGRLYKEGVAKLL